MLDDPLVHAFESATLDPTAFHHREHLYVAWCYLRELPLEAAVARYVTNLRALTEALGVTDKYHATVTWAYVVLLDDAMHRHPEASFDELMERCPELLDHRSGALLRHYRPEELAAPEARRRFVLPQPA